MCEYLVTSNTKVSNCTNDFECNEKKWNFSVNSKRKKYFISFAQHNRQYHANVLFIACEFYWIFEAASLRMCLCQRMRVHVWMCAWQKCQMCRCLIWSEWLCVGASACKYPYIVWYSVTVLINHSFNWFSSIFTFIWAAETFVQKKCARKIFFLTFFFFCFATVWLIGKVEIDEWINWVKKFVEISRKANKNKITVLQRLN